jgi:hypothetical protein
MLLVKEVVGLEKNRPCTKTRRPRRLLWFARSKLTFMVANILVHSVMNRLLSCAEGQLKAEPTHIFIIAVHLVVMPGVQYSVAAA